MDVGEFKVKPSSYVSNTVDQWLDKMIRANPSKISKREQQQQKPKEKPRDAMQGRQARLGLGAKYIPHTANHISEQAKLKRSISKKRQDESEEKEEQDEDDHSEVCTRDSTCITRVDTVLRTLFKGISYNDAFTEETKSWKATRQECESK